MSLERVSPLGDQEPFRFGPMHVTEVLTGTYFPATKADLLRHAEALGAREDVLAFLVRLPDIRYENMDQVLGMVNTLEDEGA